MNIARHLQGPGTMARREQRSVDRLGAVELSYSRELRFHQLGLEPDGLEIQGHGLPDIDDLREPWQGAKVQGELEALGIPSLRQQRLRLRRIVAVQSFKARVPVRVPDPWPDGTLQCRMIPMNPMRLDLPTQNGIGNGLPIDGQIHGLPYLSLHKGHLGVELVRTG